MRRTRRGAACAGGRLGGEQHAQEVGSEGRQALRGGSRDTSRAVGLRERENHEYEVTETHDRKKRKLTRRPLE
jgi:hypothetical protein